MLLIIVAHPRLVASRLVLPSGSFHLEHATAMLVFSKIFSTLLWADLENSYIDIDVPGQEDTISYDNAYAIRDKYEDAEENAFEDIGKDYWLEDEMVREERECYTSEGNNYCYEPGHYFTAYSSEKGGFIDCEFELPTGHKFDERRLVFNTIDLDGNDFLNSISYIMPDDDPKDPTELDNMGGDTTGKGWECNMFEITRPMEGE